MNEFSGVYEFKRFKDLIDDIFLVDLFKDISSLGIWTNYSTITA
jgi:hypothetical protein